MQLGSWWHRAGVPAAAVIGSCNQASTSLEVHVAKTAVTRRRIRLGSLVTRCIRQRGHGTDFARAKKYWVVYPRLLQLTEAMSTHPNRVSLLLQDGHERS